MPDAVDYRYDIFLSYCTEPDYRLAKRVHTALEAFHLQKHLRLEALNPLRVCRDGSTFTLRDFQQSSPTGTPTDPVRQVLEAYLTISHYLLVFCSRSAPMSEFMAFEIDWFVKHRGPNAILIAVTEGIDPQQDPSGIFPCAIVQAGIHTRPYYDLRGFHKRAAHQWKKVRDWDEELARLAAHLNDDNVDRLLPLWKEAQRLQRRRRKTAILISVLGLVTMLTLLLPRGLRVAEKSVEVSASEWRLTQDKRFALGFSALPSSFSSSNPDKHAVEGGRLWRVSSALEEAYQIPETMKDLVISADSKYVLGITLENHVVFWHLDDSPGRGQLLQLGKMLTVTDTKWDWSPTTARGFRSIGFTEDARWCFAASVDGNLTVWSIEGGSPEAVVTYRLGKAPVGDVSGYLTQDARYFLALVGPDELKILDLRRVRTGETKPIVLKRKVYRSGVSVADSWLAATTGPGEFMLVDLRGQEPQVLDIHLSPVVRLWPQLGEFEVVFAPSGNAVTVRQNEGECFVFRLPPTKNDITPAFEWHDLDLAHEKMWAVFSQDDAWVAIGSDGGSLWLCSLSDATGVLCQVALDARRSTLRVSGAAFSPDSVHIAATTTAGSISVWRPGDTPSFERSVAQHRAPPTIEFSKDGRKMLTYDASLVYFGNTGEKLERLPDQPSEIQSAAVTESGEVVIILGVRHISWERRSYYWWGIPIVNLGWF